MAWRGISGELRPFLKRKYAKLMLRVHRDNFIRAKLKYINRSLARECEYGRHPLLSKYIDLSAPVLRFAGTDSKERLNRIISKGANPRVYAVPGDLK